jgi:putative modified peptide
MEREEFHLTIRMTPKQARELGDRLADDDDFRERVMSDPQAALSDYGIEIGGPLVPETVTLPAKERIRDLGAAIQRGDEIRLDPEGKMFHPGLLLVLAIAAHEESE